MRVNVYAEEMTDRIEIICKEIDGQIFTGLRFYLELPTTVGTDDDGNPINKQGPFIHRPGDDDSSAVTFWGKRDLRQILKVAEGALDAHYSSELHLEHEPITLKRDDPDDPPFPPPPPPPPRQATKEEKDEFLEKYRRWWDWHERNSDG